MVVLVETAMRREQYICHCLQLTEDDLMQASAACVFEAVEDIVHQTGAGDGCRACRQRLAAFLRRAES